MNKLSLRVLGVSAIAAVIGTAAAQPTNLTGITWYTLDVAKHYSGGYANTFGGDTYSRNLYLAQGPVPGTDQLMNSANLTTLPTRISVDLSQPGTYNFQMFVNGDSSNVTPYWGMNLFFNNNDMSPGIAAQNAVDTAGFQVINPIGKPTLDPLTMGLVQYASNSGSLTFNNGSTSVTLTSYNTWSSGHYNLDRVDNFSDDGGLGNGTKDQVIEFSLNVKAVPEPCSLLVLGGSTLVLAVRRRFRKA